MTKCQYSGEFKKSKAQTVLIGFSKSEVICASNRAISVAVGKQPSGVLVNVNNWFSLLDHPDGRPDFGLRKQPFDPNLVSQADSSYSNEDILVN